MKRLNATPLIIAGMHRSGTSLTANWLAQCGLDMGDDLLLARHDNTSGHYEDLSFLRFHEAVLYENGVDHLVTRDQMLTLSDAQKAQARALIEARKDRAQWGWKDPRTALFLDLWRALLPQMKLLVVYRHPAHVVDSLMRRQLKQDLRKRHFAPWQRRLSHSRKLALLRRIPGFWSLVGALERPVRRRMTRFQNSFFNLRRVRRYMRVWERYNRDLLDFAAACPCQALVLHIDDLFSVSDAVIEFLNREWDFELHPVAFEAVYVPGMMQTQPMKLGEFLSFAVAPSTGQTYRRLAHRREEALRKLQTRSSEQQTG